MKSNTAHLSPRVVAASGTLVAVACTPLWSQDSAAATSESFLTTLGELILGGGFLMIPLGVCSVLTVGLAIERLWALRGGRILPRPLWEELKGDLKKGEIGAARAKVSSNDTPLARLVHSALRTWESPKSELRTTLDEAGMREADDLKKHLPALQGIASVAPLLGLLGTVVGMIQSFYTIAKDGQMGDPKLFAAPIGQALVTTAAGLSVAIPALVLFYFFRGKIRQWVRRLDDVAREVVLCHRGGE